MINSKGQISAEYFLFVMVIIGLFIAIYIFSISMQQILNRIKAFDEVGLVAFEVAHAVNTVFLGSGGLQVSVSIPSDYNFTVQRRALLATNLNDVSASASLLMDNVTVTAPGNTTELVITNLNGTIDISS